MKEYSRNVRLGFIKLWNSPDKSTRLIKEAVLPYYKGVIKEFCDEHELEKIELKETASNYHFALVTPKVGGKSYFGYNETKLLNEDILGLGANENSYIKTLRGKFNLAIAPFHELWHYKQHDIVGKHKIVDMDEFSILRAKEFLINAQDATYYNKNHDSFFFEIEAEKYSYNACIELGKKLLMGSRAGTYMIEKGETCMKDAQERLKEYKREGGFCEEVSRKCDELLQRLPLQKRVEYLNKYPVLRLLYKDNGTKKTFKELMEDRQMMLKANLYDLQKVVGPGKTTLLQRIDSIYRMIVQTDAKLRAEQRAGDLTRGMDRLPELRNTPKKQTGQEVKRTNQGITR